MAKLLLIKAANPPFKRVNDIVGTAFDDSHQFSEYELIIFNVLQILGTGEEVREQLSSNQYNYNRTVKTGTNKWTFMDDAEKKTVWQDTDNKWYFLEVRPKYTYSLSGFAVEDITILESIASGPVRDAVLVRMVINPGQRDAVNTTEARDLN